jgi:hypothetical protein
MNPIRPSSFEQFVAMAAVFAVGWVALIVMLVWQGGPKRRWLSFRRLPQYMWIGPIFSFLLSVGISIVVCLIAGLPTPLIEDEHAYVLAADTFAHGRLTNPPHPFWQHFEALHILQQPTYMAKYPPGQGIALAIGQLTTGLPIVGVWLSIALACAAICWMLQASVPPGWAMLGGLLTAIHPLSVRWAMNYWGGGVAMLGGALLVGAALRLVRRPDPGSAFVLALGIAILAASRPYEGALLTGITLVMLLVKTIRDGNLIPLLRRALPTAAVILTLAVVALLFYQRAVTGNALLSPYRVYLGAYSNTPLFVWGEASPVPEYRHLGMKLYHQDFELGYFLYQKTFQGWSHAAIHKTFDLAYAYLFSQPLALAFVIGCLAFRLTWPLLLAMAVFIGLMLPQTYVVQPHYASPGMVLVIAMTIMGLRVMWAWMRAKRGGRAAASLLVLFAILWLAPVIQGIAHFEASAEMRYRPDLIAKLQSRGGQHLVFVRETPDIPCDRFVYNLADIDHAAVIFAHDMGPEKNLELIQHYKNITCWLLELRGNGMTFGPYSDSQTSQP